MCFLTLYFLGFFIIRRSPGSTTKSRAFLFACVLSVYVCLFFFMDYEGQSGSLRQQGIRGGGERQWRVVDTKSVKFILQYALYVRAINNKEWVDSNAQIARDWGNASAQPAVHIKKSQSTRFPFSFSFSSSLLLLLSKGSLKYASLCACVCVWIYVFSANG